MSLVVADQLHDGNRHLTLRSQDGSTFLVPSWMIEAQASSVKIIDAPRLRGCSVHAPEQTECPAASLDQWLRRTIETQPYTVAIAALGIGWLLGRSHRPL